jgi:hypothetical protein
MRIDGRAFGAFGRGAALLFLSLLAAAPVRGEGDSLLVVPGALTGAKATGVAAAPAEVPAAPVSAEAAAETPGMIRGRLVKAGTDEPLRYGHVTIRRTDAPGDDRILSSDDDGRFGTELSPGTYDLSVTYFFWPEKRLAGIEVRAGEAVVLDLELTKEVLKDIRGHVVDGLTPTENVPGATVLFTPIGAPAGTMPYGAKTGPDGRFTVSMPTGTYEGRVLALNFAERTIPRLVVYSGHNNAIRVEMLPEPKLTVKEIVVSGRAIRNTAVSEIQTRRQAGAVTDGISRETIRKSADSDAAQVMGRVTGITVKDGKFLVVRGLSERYASTQVNGVRVGSPEANRKVVPMDIFPAALLDNIVVQKTYTPDQPGEFGGGAVQIRTRDIPDRPVASVTYGMGLSSGTTGEPGLSYRGGGTDWLGKDDGTRGLPDLISDMAASQKIVQKSPINPNSPGFAREDFLKLARSFDDQWAPTSEDQAPNMAWSVAGGRRSDVLGRALGVVGALSYQRSASSVTGREILTYESNDLSAEKANYTEDRTTRSVLWGATGNVTYRLGDEAALRATGLLTRSSDDEARRYEGFYRDISTDLRSERLLFSERELLTGTVGGEHPLPVLGSRFDWKLNRSSADRSEPDRRENFYERVETTVWDETEDGSVERDTTYWAFSRIGANRMFSRNEDDDGGLEAHWTLPFTGWAEGAARFRTGFARHDKERASWTRRFTFKTVSGVYADPVDSVLADDNIGTRVQFAEATRGTDYYWAGEEIEAFYGMVDMPLLKRLRMVTGARVETGTQWVRFYSKDVFTSDLEEHRDTRRDFLPAANLTWAVSTGTNFRLAASRTVNRPDLRELSPTEFTEYESSSPVIGNPRLQRALIDSYDLRVETFPGLGELLAASLFYKKLRNPIESTIQGGESPRKQPVNTKGGDNLGVEFEARLGLGRVAGLLDRFSFSGNLTLVDSEVEFDGAGGVQTSRVRPLVDQSEFVANAALFYTSPGRSTELSLYYNDFGRRLTDVGVYGQPDIYEEGRKTLDVAVTQRISSRFKLKAVGKNLTDAAVEKTQAGKLRERYRVGSSFGLSLTMGD